MLFRTRGLGRVLGVGVAILVLSTGIAHADQVRSEVNSSGGGTGTVSITAGGSVTVKYWLHEAGSCNAPLEITVNAPTGVTVSGSDVTDNKFTITACGNSSTNTKSVTFGSSALGSHSITHTFFAGGQGNAQNINQANFTLQVNAATSSNDAPVLTLNNVGPVEGNTLGGALVSFNMSASDTEDGDLTSAIVCDYAETDVFPVGTTTVTCDVEDSDGATDSGTFTVTVVDTTPPAVTVPSNITTGPTQWNGAVVTFSSSAYDIVDGSLTSTCVPASGSLFGFGANNVTCSATDAQSNLGSNSFTVTVNGFVFDGFFAPVDRGKWNVVKAGQTIPLKWRLWGENGQITDTQAVIKAQSFVSPCDNSSSDLVEETATGGTSLRYDLSGEQFIFNWQTPKTRGCFKLTLTLSDASSHVVLVMTK